VETVCFPHAISARRREYLALCASQGSMTRLLHSHHISIIGRPTTFGVLLQTSEDDYLGGGHDKDTLSPRGTQGLECLSLQTALYLGDRLNTRRRLVGFSLLSTIRCQTSWISPTTEYVTIPPTMAWGRDSSLSSSQTRGRKTLWNDLLKFPTWNMPNVSTGAPENPLGILFTVHIGVSRGPQTLCPLCL